MGEPHGGGMQGSVEELHLRSQRRAPGRGTFIIIGSSRPFLAQPDIPPTVDINHDFSIIDPLPAMEGKKMCGSY